VIRSVHQGESHGGVYLVDLQSQTTEQVLDWADEGIDWEGRGGDRGLRGIAIHEGHVYLAASDEVFVYDRTFRQLRSFRNPYLRHCHEINLDGDRLYLASTGHDSVLEYDIRTEAFSRGWTLRYGSGATAWKRLGGRPSPNFRPFDPNASGGPAAADTTHINNVWPADGTIYACGTRLGTLWQIRDGRLGRAAKVPFGTHNARPFRDGVLFNHTEGDRIVYADRRGAVRATFDLPTYPATSLLHADLPGDLARPTFGRGLTVVDDSIVVGGSSPATISAYDIETTQRIASVNITMDVRNAVHGLELWPFDEPGS
jgi:hypothetical protein